jgi:hypothetical protein
MVRLLLALWWALVRWGRLNAFFIFGAIAAVFLLGIPQISNVMTQTVEVGEAASQDRELALLFLGFLFITGTYSAGSVLGVNTPLRARGLDAVPIAFPDAWKWWIRLGAGGVSIGLLALTGFLEPPLQLWTLLLAVLGSVPLAVCVIGFLSGSFVWIFRRVERRSTRVLFGVTLFAVSLGVLAYAQHEQLGLTGSLFWQVTAIVMLLGAWLTLSAIPRAVRSHHAPRDVPDHSHHAPRDEVQSTPDAPLEDPHSKPHAPPDVPPPARQMIHEREVLVAPGRVLAWFTMSLAIAEFVWWAAVIRSEEGWSFRLYTIWGVMNVAALVVVFGGMLDHWLAETGWPMRFFGLAALAILFAGFWSRPQTMNLKQPPAVTRRVVTADTQQQQQQQQQQAQQPRGPSDEVVEDWYDHILARLSAIDANRREGDPKPPVVLVAASGGGSRAAVFAALVLEALEREPLGTSGRSWAQHILMISSVSGGSLATGYYTHAITRPAPTPNPNATGSGPVSDPQIGKRLPESRLGAEREPRYALRSEVVTRMKRIIHEAITEELGELPYDTLYGLLEPLEHDLDQWMASEDKWSLHECKAFKDTKLKTARSVRDWRITRGMLKTWRDCESLELYHEYEGPSQWILRSAFVDDMWVDFMAPIIRGALTPTVNRGQTLRYFWNSQFGWAESNSADGYAYTPSTRATGVQSTPEMKPAYRPHEQPVVFFNTCDVQLGTRVVVGFPTLPKEIFLAPHEPPNGDGELVRRPRVLDESKSPHVVPLADAVGMSANFPFGFNILRVDNVRTPNVDQKGKSLPTHLIDGGFVDNTGIDTIFEVLRGLQAVAHSKETASTLATAERSPSSKAEQILERLKGRKVLLFEIDSGAKPEEARWFTKQASLLLEPVNGYTNVSYTNAERSKQNYLSELDRLAGPLDTAPVPNPQSPATEKKPSVPALQHLPFVCNHIGDDNVMTAWALGPEDKALVLIRFLTEYHVHEFDLKQPTLDLLSRNLVQTLQQLDEQLQALPANPSQQQIQAVKKLADNALAMQSQLHTLGARADDQRAAQRVQNALEQISKAGSTMSAKDVDDVKQVSKDLELEAWQKAAERNRDAMGAPAGKIIDTKQYFDKRAPVRKKS